MARKVILVGGRFEESLGKDIWKGTCDQFALWQRRWGGRLTVSLTVYKGTSSQTSTEPLLTLPGHVQAWVSCALPCGLCFSGPCLPFLPSGWAGDALQGSQGTGPCGHRTEHVCQSKPEEVGSGVGTGYVSLCDVSAGSMEGRHVPEDFLSPYPLAWFCTCIFPLGTQTVRLSSPPYTHTPRCIYVYVCTYVYKHTYGIYI